MTVEESIEAALLGRVRDLDTFDADHKAWPNNVFDPTTEPWLRIDLLPNEGQRFFMRGIDPHLYLGILQLTVVSPLNAGPSIAKGLAGLVAGHFPPDLALYESGIKVRIERAPDIARAFPVDAYWQVPVSIRYQCFAAPNNTDIPSMDFSIVENSQYVPLI